MDFENEVLNCLLNMKRLILQKNALHWAALDFYIYAAVHNMRLFSAFSDRTRPNIQIHKDYAISKLNTYICIRNKMYSMLHPHFNSELGNNGPLGIILYLTNIQECLKCYTVLGLQEVPLSFNIRSQCSKCLCLFEPHILSKLCDIHGPRRCHMCGSFKIVATQQNKNNFNFINCFIDIFPDTDSSDRSTDEYRQLTRSVSI
jgi:hypothetical protein